MMPGWSFRLTGTLPRLISFICHSLVLSEAEGNENTGGVGVFFPFWNSIGIWTFTRFLGEESVLFS